MMADFDDMVLDVLRTRLRTRLTVDRRCGEEGSTGSVEFKVELVLLPPASASIRAMEATETVDDTELDGAVVVAESTGYFNL